MINNGFAIMSVADGNAAHMVDFIKPDTTPAGFDQERRLFKNYILNMASFRLNTSDVDYETALGAAARVANIDLIKHFVNEVGPSLFLLSNNYCETPLHAAIDCQDKEKGPECVRTLLQLGAPVNIMFEDGSGQTPLEYALSRDGNQESAAILIRAGGVARELDDTMQANFEAAKQLIKDQNAKAAIKALAFTLHTIKNRIPIELTVHVHG